MSPYNRFSDRIFSPLAMIDICSAKVSETCLQKMYPPFCWKFWYWRMSDHPYPSVAASCCQSQNFIHICRLRLISVCCNLHQIRAPALLTGLFRADLNCKMNKLAVFCYAVPMLYGHWNLDNIAKKQLLGGLAPFLHLPRSTSCHSLSSGVNSKSSFFGEVKFYWLHCNSTSTM